MTELFDTLDSDMKQAMRDRDKTRLSAIRMIRSALQNALIAKGPDGSIDEAEAADVLAREARQRRESIEEFRKAGRDETIPEQEQELAVVLAYMPQRLSRDEIAEEARKLISELGARGSWRSWSGHGRHHAGHAWPGRRARRGGCCPGTADAVRATLL